MVAFKLTIAKDKLRLDKFSSNEEGGIFVGNRIS